MYAEQSPLDAPAVATRPAAPPQPYSPFLPLALLGSALLLLVGFQTVQLAGERATLREILERQTAPLQEAQKLRAQLDSIAGKTAELAAAGNPNARRLLDELSRRGITIAPPTAGDPP
ncbi:MAG: hypothetical protein M3Z21_17410 [Pseudomonadota bacterium]|nr:hypothetical protein [Pseudomonadota bacterium]